MERKHNKSIVPTAKMLRKNMTKEERKLWYEFLREHPQRFTRQKVLGRYIVDFYCAKANLVIELDGNQHYEDKNIEEDTARTEYLKGFGLSVVRIPNIEVRDNFYGVCEYINDAIEQSLSQQS